MRVRRRLAVAPRAELRLTARGAIQKARRMLTGGELLVRQHLKECTLEKMKGYIERNERQLAAMNAQLQVRDRRRDCAPGTASSPFAMTALGYTPGRRKPRSWRSCG